MFVTCFSAHPSTPSIKVLLCPPPSIKCRFVGTKPLSNSIEGGGVGGCLRLCRYYYYYYYYYFISYTRIVLSLLPSNRKLILGTPQTNRKKKVSRGCEVLTMVVSLAIKIVYCLCG